MNFHHRNPSTTASEEYHARMTGERFGFVIYKDLEEAYSPVHPVWMHPEDGPVIVVGEKVLEIDPDEDEIYATREEALDAYYSHAGQENHSLKASQSDERNHHD